MPVSAWRVAFVSSHIKWLLIVAGILGFAGAWMQRTEGVTYWPLATASIVFNAQIVISLACLGFAAWQARTDRQPGIAELTGTFPASPAYQVFISWSAVAAWGLLAYLATVLLSIGAVARDAHWGYPEWQGVAQGAAVVVGASAIGYGLGRALPTYLLIPVWAVGWFALDGVLALRESPIRWAAPRSTFQNVDRSIFRESVPPMLELKQALGFIAVSLFVISLCLLSAARGRRTIAAVAAASFLLVSASVPLFSVSGEAPYGTGRPRHFDPVCEHNEVVTVCLHPAERPLLEKTATLLALALEPVAGLPGVPVEFVDSAVRADSDSIQGGVYVYSEADLDAHIAESLINALFPNDLQGGGITLTKEQAIVATWLYARAGFPYEAAPYWMFTLAAATIARDQVMADVVAEAEAFGQVPPETQRAWLERHWSALRTGAPDSAELP